MSEAVTRCLISPLVGARDELSDEETESDSWINPGEVNKFFISFNIGGKCVMCRNTYVHETSARGSFCRLITKLNQWQFGFVSQWSWVQIPANNICFYSCFFLKKKIVWLQFTCMND